MSNNKPWIIDTTTLEQQIGDANLRIIDMTNKFTYQDAHIPTAVFVDYKDVVQHKPPVMGMLPDEAAFAEMVAKLGITPDTYLVAYDDEGGAKAARFLWTMEIAGHKNLSLLDGGIHAWRSDQKPLSDEVVAIEPCHYPISFDETSIVADADYIMAHLQEANFSVLDTRSKNEFTGADQRAVRAGHIPGAVNLDWLDIKNSGNAQRIKSPEELESMLGKLGLYPDQEVVTHCHSHHRSALMYVALKSLGYSNVKGYPASWSDWAVRKDTPVEN